MASATQLPGPMEIASSSSAQTTSSNPPPPEQCTAQLELGITLTLFLWAPLTLAVTNQWGGPDSSDKREWFASETISQLLANPDADIEWIETWLLQVMLDEFEVNVDDESAFEVAEQIVRLRRDCGRGQFGEVRGLKERWDLKGGRDVVGSYRKVERGEEEDETDGSEEDTGEEDGEGDVQMDEAPQLVRAKEKVEPEVDEEGFTKVIKKKK